MKENATPWGFYDMLIEGVPEDVLVTDYCLGTHWSYLQAECGMGVSFSTRGGAKQADKRDLRGLPLREVAALSKSWSFPEASIGVAALNAWYARRELTDALGAVYDETVDLPDGTIRKIDAFELYRPEIASKGNAKVTVVGHFPHVDRIAEYAELTVLERSPSGDDLPDPACEYVVPEQDYLFMTGVTIINKTAPRLLALAEGVTTIMVGPSVVMSPKLFDYGVDMLAGSVVADPEKTKFAVKTGAGQFFGEALQMCSIRA